MGKNAGEQRAAEAETRQRAQEENHVACGPKKDRSVSAGAMGEVEGAAEEGCLEPTEPAASMP
jgi:hypothetical protein